MKFFSIFIIFILFRFSASAQKETDNWVFGDRYWVDFSTGAPVLKTSSAIDAPEGCSSISDEQGRLLFYTNGEKVWSAQHELMPNGVGLAGGRSSAQNSVIVRHPLRKSIYYIFTAANLTAGANSAENFSYSTVNMELNGKLGDVEEKNFTLLQGKTGEAVTATIDCSGKGAWIITHSRGNSNIFYAFRLTEKGLNTTPVVSPFDVSPAEQYRVSRIKISPDTRLLALTENDGNAPALALYDFNYSTGVVKNKRELMNGVDDICYGASFSPDNTKLYVSQASYWQNPYFEHSLAQFTVNLPDEAAIRASKVNLPHYDGGSSSLQLASNGKIYLNHYLNNSNYLSVIDKPNLAGAACNYRSGVVLLKENTNPSTTSVPNFPDSYFFAGQHAFPCALPESGFKSDTICQGGSMQYQDISSNFPGSWKWKFSGGEPAEFDGKNPPPVFYAESGIFETTLITANSYGIDTVVQSVLVRALPDADAGADVVICPGGSARLGAAAVTGNTYSWTPASGLDNDAIAQPTANPASDTWYYLTVTNSFGCFLKDSVFVSVGEIRALVNLKENPDTAICAGSSVLLTASGGTEYDWSPANSLSASTGNTVVASPALTTEYRLIASSGTCRDTLFFTITVNDVPIADAGANAEICSGESVTLGPQNPDPLATYYWTPGDGVNDPNSPNPVASPQLTTVYYLEVKNGAGCVSFDTVSVTVKNQVSVSTGNDTTVCDNTPVQLSAVANLPDLQYKWTPEEGLSDVLIANPIATPEKTTTYYVTAFKNPGLCSAVDSVTIIVLKNPEIFILRPDFKDTTLCEGQTIQLQTFSNDASLTYEWSPADGLDRTDIPNPLLTVVKNQAYTLKVTNQNGCTTFKSIAVKMDTEQKITAAIKTSVPSVEPGEASDITLTLRSENSERGITSFKARVNYERGVFRYRNPTVKFLKGADTGWVITAVETAQNGILIEGRGTTEIFDAAAGFELEAFLAKQTDVNILLKVEEINGIATLGEQPCRTVAVTSAMLDLNMVCGGDLRLVSVGEYETHLQAISPNPVIGENLTIEYSIGIESPVKLEIYDQRGKLRQTLVQENQKPGKYSAVMRASDLEAGAYVCMLSTLHGTYTVPFVIVK
jgi:hypothetical protein